MTIPPPGSWIAIFLGVFLGVHMTVPAGMVLYHVQLIWVNLTTNEHINTSKYDYLWHIVATGDPARPVVRRYRNPWNHGPWHNLLARLFPSDASYLLPAVPVATDSSVGGDHPGKEGNLQVGLLQQDILRMSSSSGDHIVWKQITMDWANELFRVYFHGSGIERPTISFSILHASRITGRGKKKWLPVCVCAGCAHIDKLTIKMDLLFLIFNQPHPKRSGKFTTTEMIYDNYKSGCRCFFKPRPEHRRTAHVVSPFFSWHGPMIKN